VAAGVVLAAGGTVWASVIRDFVLKASGAAGDKLQSQFVTWEISVLAMLVGGAMAGANTRRGPLQGFLVGTVAACVLCAFQFFLEGGQRLPIQDVLASAYGLPAGEGSPAALTILAAQTWLLGIAGGWLGSQLLPPTVAGRRKTFDSAAH
jgi:putative membrane protein (TIGR04086 family)